MGGHDPKQKSGNQEERGTEAVDLREQGKPISRSFWDSPTLDELAQAQNVKPLEDVRSLSGTWPGEQDDGFEEAIDELRHQDLAGADPL